MSFFKKKKEHEEHEEGVVDNKLSSEKKGVCGPRQVHLYAGSEGETREFFGDAMRLNFKTKFLEELCGRTHELAFSLQKPA